MGLAEAEGDYWVGFFGLETGQSDAALAHTRDVAKADANLAFVTATANADFEWLNGRAAIPPSTEDPDGEPAVVGIVAGGCTQAQGSATGWRNLQVTLATIARDSIIDCLPHEEVHTNSYASAQAGHWIAKVASTSDRNTAEAIAIADFRSAHYAQSAIAVAGIDADINLPWTAYQADLAESQSAWWIAHGHSSQIAAAGAVNGAIETMASTIATAWVAWVEQVAEASQTQDEADAEAYFDLKVAFANAEEQYRFDVATEDETWQVSMAQAAGVLDVATATEFVSWIQSGNSAAEFTVSQALLQAFTEASATANRSWMTGESVANALRVDSVSDGYLSAITSTYAATVGATDAHGDANIAFAIAIWNAVVAFKTAIAIAEANHFVVQATTYADAAAAVAVSSPAIAQDFRTPAGR